MMSLMLAAGGLFTGVWEVSTDGDGATYYLIIHEPEDIRVFGANWYPARVRMSKWEGSTLKIDFYPSDKLQMFSLEADLSDDTSTGLMRIPTANFTAESEVILTRKSTFPYSEPWAILSDRERNEPVDLIEFLIQRAPMESFEDFYAFWEEDFSSRYYFFLYPLTEKGGSEDGESKREKVKGFYDSLVENRLSIVQVKSGLSAESGFTPVLVPDLGQSPVINAPVTSYKIPLPPGVKICCGLKTHDIENFQLVKVGLDNISEASGATD